MGYHEFYDEFDEYGSFAVFYIADNEATEDMEAGYYWWPCFPGCLPDGEANGPFSTYDEAVADANKY